MSAPGSPPTNTRTTDSLRAAASGVFPNDLSPRSTACALILGPIGISADHGGFELKEFLLGKLREDGHQVIDFGDTTSAPDDDYPDFVVPMARAVGAGNLSRGVAICGSGVGASVAANKVAGVRACLIHEHFSAHQGVEDDNLNVICLGGRVVGHSTAWELLETFLAARFSGAERHVRRVEKVMSLEAGMGNV